MSTLCWAVTGAATIIGAAFGHSLVSTEDHAPSFTDALVRIDGENYRHVIEKGYSYDPKRPSYVAFFPGYPLAVRCLAHGTGLPTVLGQLIVSNAFGLATFIAAGTYLRARAAATGEPGLKDGIVVAEQLRDSASYSLLAMGLLPTTFFFRVGYSESMFMCLAVFSLYAIVRDWPLAIVSIIVGLATAVRPVGVALLIPLVVYAYQSSASKWKAVVRLAYALPLACCGLAAFMVFQYLKFGQPLAFALTQTYHRMRPMGTTADKWLSLLSWEPIRDTYNPASPGYWQALHYVPSRLFSLEFANPIYFLGTAALIALGAWKRWLTNYEILLAVPLLAIPYFTRAYEMRMLSQARFAAVVFPVYIVIGHLLARMPLVISGALLALSGLMMGLYAALFAAGYPFL